MRHRHHVATGRLTPLERLELGGDVPELDLPADDRADRSGPGEVQDAAPDVDSQRGGPTRSKFP